MESNRCSFGYLSWDWGIIADFKENVRTGTKTFFSGAFIEIYFKGIFLTLKYMLLSNCSCLSQEKFTGLYSYIGGSAWIWPVKLWKISST